MEKTIIEVLGALSIDHHPYSEHKNNIKPNPVRISLPWLLLSVNASGSDGVSSCGDPMIGFLPMAEFNQLPNPLH